jgi:arginase
VASHPSSGHRRIAIIGVPFNSSGTTDGVARAPAAIREAGLVDALTTAGLDVEDRGDVSLGPTSPTRDPVSGVISPTALTAMIRSVRAGVDSAIRAGRFPIILGGDCPILLGCLGASAPGSRAVLFVDGHEDAWPPEASTTGEAADMELGFALGLTTGALPEPLRQVLPRLDPGRVIVVGARDPSELDDAGVPSIDDIVEVIRPPAIDAAAAGRLGASAMARLAAAGSTWYHVDLDVLATSSLAAVDYPQPGGLDWPTLTARSRGALRHPSVAGWVVTIYNPNLDPDRSGAERIVRYVVDVLQG